MRDNDFDRRMTGNAGARNSGTMIALAVAAILVIGVLFLWPRSTDTTASNTSAGVTTGQSRPTTAPAPAPAPAAPANPR